jgi:Domain of unknown function (DUF397)
MSLNNLKTGGLQWRKARRSVNNGACVEVAPSNGQIFVRDSKDQDGHVMEYTGPSWRAFITSAKVGRFDLDRL